jgi:hypothetical protein
MRPTPTQPYDVMSRLFFLMLGLWGPKSKRARGTRDQARGHARTHSPRVMVPPRRSSSIAKVANWLLPGSNSVTGPGTEALVFNRVPA